MIILVLGAKGQLGRCIYEQLADSTHEVIYASREHINIAEFEDAKDKILDISPHFIINTAAYTDVDKAESEQEEANIINHLAVANIANICCQLNCWLIHISTDYVFDGKSKTPYKENDRPNPQGIYGQTKLMGEKAIQLSGCMYIILRTSWIFSEYGNNFLKTMLRLGKQHDQLNIVGDQIGCPTYAQDIASTVLVIIQNLNVHKKSGIYHFCGDLPCSWHKFSKAIFEEAKTRNLKIPSKINSIATSDYPTLAVRPSFSVLNCSKIEKEFGVFPSNWILGIKMAISKIKY